MPLALAIDIRISVIAESVTEGVASLDRTEARLARPKVGLNLPVLGGTDCRTN